MPHAVPKTHCVGGAASLGIMRTGAWPDVRHINEGSSALEEGWVVQGDTSTETLRVDSLAELSVCHRDGGLVVSWGKKNNQQDFFPLGTIFNPQISPSLYPVNCQKNDPLEKETYFFLFLFCCCYFVNPY